MTFFKQIRMVRKYVIVIATVLLLFAMLLEPCQAGCYVWNSKKWEGSDCNPSPVRTECGCPRCRKCADNCASFPQSSTCCATEKSNALCECNGQVRYGVGTQWSRNKAVRGSTECSTNAFGGDDPARGVEKYCECNHIGTITCNVGQRLDVASADCVACDSESYQDEADHQNTECKQQPKCTRGYVLGSPSTDSLHSRHAKLECIACPENTYMPQDKHTNRACTVQPSCSKGQYITPDSSVAERECKTCAVSSFQSKETHRELECLPQTTCLKGQRLNAASTTQKGKCTNCDPGEYQAVDAFQGTTCNKCGPLECPKGQFLIGKCERTAGDTLQCTNCVQHEFGDTVHAAVLGDDVTVPDENAYPCKPCAVECKLGQYPAYDHQGTCGSGKRSTANQATCKPCSAGMWGLGTRGNKVKQLDNVDDWGTESAWCQACGNEGEVDNSKYQNVNTLDENRMTPDVSSSSESGAKMAPNPGFYQDSPGQGECKQCQDFCPRGETTMSACTATTPRTCDDKVPPRLCTGAAGDSSRCNSQSTTNDASVFEAGLDPFEIAAASVFTGDELVETKGTDPATCFDPKADNDTDLTTSVHFSRVSPSFLDPAFPYSAYNDVLGDHIIEYNCKDFSDNEATSATRTISVTDTTPPTLVLCEQGMDRAVCSNFLPMPDLPPNVSAYSCTRLGSFSADSWPVHEGSSVCGESDANFLNRNSNKCFSRVNFETAAQVCADVGARLCSEVEMLAGVTKSTGCSFDPSLVWTFDTCTRPDGSEGRVSARGQGRAGSYEGKEDTQCQATGTALPVRCCADDFDQEEVPKCPLQYGSEASKRWSSWIGGITTPTNDAATEIYIDVSLNIKVGSGMRQLAQKAFEKQRDRTDLPWIVACDVRDRLAGIDHEGPGTIEGDVAKEPGDRIADWSKVMSKYVGSTRPETGTAEIVYRIADASNNVGEIKRKVLLFDGTPPELFLWVDLSQSTAGAHSYSNPLLIEAGNKDDVWSSYVDFGVRVEDVVDGNLDQNSMLTTSSGSANVKEDVADEHTFDNQKNSTTLIFYADEAWNDGKNIPGVNDKRLGRYKIEFTAFDKSENAGGAERWVVVQDTLPPVMTLAWPALQGVHGEYIAGLGPNANAPSFEKTGWVNFGLPWQDPGVVVSDIHLPEVELLQNVEIWTSSNSSQEGKLCCRGWVVNCTQPAGLGRCVDTTQPLGTAFRLVYKLTDASIDDAPLHPARIPNSITENVVRTVVIQDRMPPSLVLRSANTVDFFMADCNEDATDDGVLPLHSGGQPVVSCKSNADALNATVEFEDPGLDFADNYDGIKVIMFAEFELVSTSKLNEIKRECNVSRAACALKHKGKAYVGGLGEAGYLPSPHTDCDADDSMLQETNLDKTYKPAPCRDESGNFTVVGDFVINYVVVDSNGNLAEASRMLTVESLPEASSGLQQTTAVAVACSGVLVLVAIAVLCWCKRRKASRSSDHHGEKFQLDESDDASRASKVDSANVSVVENPMFTTGLKLGDRVKVKGYPCEGIVRFVGMHISGKKGMRCGVELDEPIGKNDGTVDFHEYFECDENCGLLVNISKVSLAVPAEDEPDSDATMMAERMWHVAGEMSREEAAAKIMAMNRNKMKGSFLIRESKKAANSSGIPIPILSVCINEAGKVVHHRITVNVAGAFTLNNKQLEGAPDCTSMNSLIKYYGSGDRKAAAYLKCTLNLNSGVAEVGETTRESGGGGQQRPRSATQQVGAPLQSRPRSSSNPDVQHMYGSPLRPISMLSLYNEPDSKQPMIFDEAAAKKKEMQRKARTANRNQAAKSKAPAANLRSPAQAPPPPVRRRSNRPSSSSATDGDPESASRPVSVYEAPSVVQQEKYDERRRSSLASAVLSFENDSSADDSDGMYESIDPTTNPNDDGAYEAVDPPPNEQRTAVYSTFIDSDDDSDDTYDFDNAAIPTVAPQSEVHVYTNDSVAIASAAAASAVVPVVHTYKNASIHPYKNVTVVNPKGTQSVQLYMNEDDGGGASDISM